MALPDPPISWGFRQGATREIHPLDLQRHRHSMLVPRVCAPRVTRCSLGKYWSRDLFQKEAGWLPVLERVCISLVSLFRRRVFNRRALLFYHTIKMVRLYSLESQLSEYLNFIAVTGAVPELQQVEVEVEATHWDVILSRSDRLPRRWG